MAPRLAVRVGIIGGGLMGRELAATLGRWPALTDDRIVPTVSAVCDTNPSALEWFRRIASVQHLVGDYRRLLEDNTVDVLYVALPHHLHESVYLAAIQAGKDFLGEKPFGFDRQAAEVICEALASAPRVFARCSSEIPFFSGAQFAYGWIRSGALGRILEVECSFLHASDLDVTKPVNWKRQVKYCGPGGVMNDLGMHALHLPLRLGWFPAKVFSFLQNIVPERPDHTGTMVPSDTYDNATLLAAVEHDGYEFPLTLQMKRIAPGEANTWRIRAVGMKGGVEFSTRYPKTVWLFRFEGGRQSWSQVEVGSQSTFPTITIPAVEFGFTDAVLQMWAAYLTERAGDLGDRFGCATPQEALLAHRVVAAALKSSATSQAVTA